MENTDLKSKSTAAILAFFLGGFGAHLYYLGKTNRGLFYNLLLVIAFCLVIYGEWIVAWGIGVALGLIAFLDFIYLIVMNENKFNEEYNDGLGNEPLFDATEELKKLFELKQMGAITEEEYNKKKVELLK